MTTRAHAAIATASALVLVAVAAFARNPARVEALYGREVSPVSTRLLPAVTRWVPFSVAEWLVPVGLVVLVVPALWAMARAVRARTGVGRAAAHEAARIAALAGVAIAGFYLLWGLNYARPDLPTRSGWRTDDTVKGAAATAELERLAAALVTSTNEAYVAATGTRDLGAPSQLPATDMDAAIDTGYQRAAQLLGWPPGDAISRGPAKPLLTSRLMSRLGLSGIYFAWTGEANYNRDTPPPQVPLTIAHEKAHQRGVASEDEANFVGWLAATLAPEPYVRYSAQLFAQRQLLTELAARDPDATAALLAQRYPGVQRDVDAANAYWKRFEGPAREAQESFNDAYLQLNGVEEGIGSYARSAQLLVLFARQRGGDIVLLGEVPAAGS